MKQPSPIIIVLLSAVLLLAWESGAAGNEQKAPKPPRTPATPATPAPPAPAPDTEHGAYLAIKDMIYDAQYQQAHEASLRFLKKYSGSASAEEVSFWRCYALQRARSDSGKSFECYEAFLARYPDGNWSDDARSELAKVAKKLAKAGDPRGKAALEMLSGYDEEGEFKLSVIYALYMSGDPADRAFATKSIHELLKTSQDADLRRKVLYVLIESDDPATMETLIHVAKSDPDPDVRRHAIYAISEHSNDPKVIDTLVAIMKSEKDPDIRRHVLYAIAEVDRPDVVKVLSDAALNDSDPDIRTAATYAIAEVDDPAAVSALKSLLKSSTSLEIKRAALYALIERDDVDIVPDLKTLALSTGGSSDERELRRAAVYALAETDDPSAADVLAEVVKTSDDREVKQAAFYALAELGGPDAESMLKGAALDDRDEDMARSAVYALGDLLDEDETGFLLDVYRKSPFESVRRAALDLSMSIGGNQSATALGAMLEGEKNADQRRVLVWALSDIETDESVSILARVARHDDDREVRRQAVEALAQMGTPSAKKALRELLEDKP